MDDILDKPPKRSLLPIIGVLVAFVALLGAVGYFYWTNRQPANPIPQAPLPSSTSTQQIETPTSTAENPTISNTTEVPTYKSGDTIRLFEGDVVYISSEKENGLPYRLKADGFTDSRCPAGVQCIWAGERGVDLGLTLADTDGLNKSFFLKEKTAPTSTVEGLKFTLITIDDSKGGTYADIKVE
ncbi:MAG: hypothetical protein WC641_07715 [Patescibacteria group bacterium]